MSNNRYFLKQTFQELTLPKVNQQPVSKIHLASQQQPQTLYPFFLSLLRKHLQFLRPKESKQLLQSSLHTHKNFSVRIIIGTHQNQPRSWQPRSWQPRSWQPRSWQRRSWQPRSWQPRTNQEAGNQEAGNQEPTKKVTTKKLATKNQPRSWQNRLKNLLKPIVKLAKTVKKRSKIKAMKQILQNYRF